MDANVKHVSNLLVQRQKRWSMTSQRLEEIVEQLMRPIGDRRQIFDTDSASLLEEYLTEAGIRVLEHEGTEVSEDTKTNFVEVAFLLQQSANIYGQKVDYLYERVVSVSNMLLNHEQQETEQADSRDQITPRSRREQRRRQYSSQGVASFELEYDSSGIRTSLLPRAPPTLPPILINLEPRLITEFDAPLYDYEGEQIGLVADFYVALRLQDGVLVDELTDTSASEISRLWPIPLLELQAAIEAAAPRDLSPPPAEADAEAVPSPPAEADAEAGSEAILPPPAEVGAGEFPPPATRRALASKRKQHDNTADISGLVVKMRITDAMLEKLQIMDEFSINSRWIEQVVGKRKNTILSERQQLRSQDLIDRTSADFDSLTGEFLGWSAEECHAALRSLRHSTYSDDGLCAALDEPLTVVACTGVEWSEWSEWQTRIINHATAAEARGVDVRALARRVLSALPAPPLERDFTHVLRETAREQREVSTLFLSTLFLANAGNVEIIQNAPLSSSFSLRLLSTDETLYTTAAAADEHLLKGQNAFTSSVGDSTLSANDNQFNNQPTPCTSDHRERHRHHNRYKQLNGEHSPTHWGSNKRRNGELVQHFSHNNDSSQYQSKRHRDNTFTKNSKTYERHNNCNDTHKNSKIYESRTCSDDQSSQIEVNNSTDNGDDGGINRRCCIDLTNSLVTLQMSDLQQNTNAVSAEDFMTNINDCAFSTAVVNDSGIPITNVDGSGVSATNVNDSEVPITNINDSGFSSTFTLSINSEPSTDRFSPDYTCPTTSTGVASSSCFTSPVRFASPTRFTSPNR